MKFQELTDSQWNAVMPCLPKPAATGRPRNDGRIITANAVIMSVLVAGCRWTDLPVQCGSKSSAHRRFQELQKKGVWKKILSGLIRTSHRQGKADLQKISIDSSSIAAKKGAT